MYHAHFGLKRPLFDGGIAQDQSVFRAPKHEQLVERFKLALASPCSAITLTGPPGIGKTTLTSAALRASQTRLAIAWLHGLVTNGTELVELLLAELGLAAERTTRVERLQLWRQFHSEMSATESRVFVVAERADDLPVEVLRALDGLTAPDATGYTGANLILLGQAGLEQHLEAPTLESLRQRIRLRARLEPFTEGELQDYLRHQTACAGGDYDRVFAPGTVAALFRHSRGVARRANHLCETALAVAADAGDKLLTPAVVQRVATTMLGESDGAAPAPPPVTLPPAAAELASAAPLAAAAPAPFAPPATVTFAVAGTGPSIVVAPPAAAQPTATPVPPSPPTPQAQAPLPAAPTAGGPSAASPAGATHPPPATLASPSPPRAGVESAFEFDGEATEVPDVSIVDFPVLTDAVDETPALPPAMTKPPPPAQAPAPTGVSASPPSAPAPRPAAPSAATRTPPVTPPAPARPTPVAAEAPPARRIETAYAPSRSAAVKPPAPSAAPASARTAPLTPEPARVPPPQSDPEGDDVLRQTQTMRAIAVAKSIDDISSSMAETLFGEAELDILNAALAASIDDSTDTVPPPVAPVAAPAPAPRPASPVTPPRAAAATAPPPRKPPVSTGDDLLDLLDLTSDATLELMDDPLDKPAASGSYQAGRRR